MPPCTYAARILFYTFFAVYQTELVQASDVSDASDWLDSPPEQEHRCSL